LVFANLAKSEEPKAKSEQMATAAHNLTPDARREFLRHAVATLAYRGGKALRGAPAEFASFRVAEGSRTPGQILAHLGDLFDWALSNAEGNERWYNSEPLVWEDGVRRFHAALQVFDDYLASGKPLAVSAESLFQGPVADALTHVGQIAYLRRVAGVAVKGENYFRAEIVAGRVGPEQATPKREF
jgi:hypothetical protein